jgi:hypothetical protein
MPQKFSKIRRLRSKVESYDNTIPGKHTDKELADSSTMGIGKKKWGRQAKIAKGDVGMPGNICEASPGEHVDKELANSSTVGGKKEDKGSQAKTAKGYVGMPGNICKACSSIFTASLNGRTCYFPPEGGLQLPHHNSLRDMVAAVNKAVGSVICFFVS